MGHHRQCETAIHKRWGVFGQDPMDDWHVGSFQPKFVGQFICQPATMRGGCLGATIDTQNCFGHDDRSFGLK